MKDNICKCFACQSTQMDTIKIEKHNGRFKEFSAPVNCLKEQIALTHDSDFSSTITVKNNSFIPRPVQIINLLDYQNEQHIEEQINIIVGENAQITFLYCDDTLPKTNSKVFHKINVELRPNAKIDFYKLENVNNQTCITSNIVFNLESASQLKTFFFTLNGDKLENNICVNFNGEHAQADLNGLYLMDQSQSVKTTMKVYHYKDSCRSNQLFKGILDDTAKADFLGHIFVDYNAKNNDARQTNNNILLTDKAKVNTRPVLEIYNDDVQCSHGATTGQLDNQALYYLRTRGISEKKAKMLLMNAFCQSVLQKSDIEELRTGLADMIQKRLDGEQI